MNHTVHYEKLSDQFKHDYSNYKMAEDLKLQIRNAQVGFTLMRKNILSIRKVPKSKGRSLSGRIAAL
jgi:hypothetical protein